MPRLRRLLVTGAAGNLGRLCRARLVGLAETLRLSDLGGLGEAGPGEELAPCDLRDFEAVRAAVRGCDGVVHLGGFSVEGPWATILGANIEGTYHLYEAARLEGCRRILFASSNHAVGFHRREDRLDAGAPLRPDSLYGVSKCFGEALARLWFDKFGVETAIVRIGSCFPEPLDHRMLATWLSSDDFVSLIEAVFRAPRLGCPIVYAASDNAEQWWDNSAVAYLGWRPKDSSERFRAGLDARMAPPPPDDALNRFQGGGFAKSGRFED